MESISYIKYLIKANNSQITDSEIDTLLKDTRQKKIVITEKGKKFKKNLLKKVQEFEKRLSDSLTPIFVTLEIQKLLWLWITER